MANNSLFRFDHGIAPAAYSGIQTCLDPSGSSCFAGKRKLETIFVQELFAFLIDFLRSFGQRLRRGAFPDDCRAAGAQSFHDQQQHQQTVSALISGQLVPVEIAAGCGLTDIGGGQRELEY